MLSVSEKPHHVLHRPFNDLAIFSLPRELIRLQIIEQIGRLIEQHFFIVRFRPISLLGITEKSTPDRIIEFQLLIQREQRHLLTFRIVTPETTRKGQVNGLGFKKFWGIPKSTMHVIILHLHGIENLGFHRGVNGPARLDP